jgi:hypothetical protein
VEVPVDGVGDGAVGQRERVGVFAQGGGGVGVPEAGLGGEDFTASDEEGGDGVPEPVQGGVWDAGGVAHEREAVAEGFGAESVVVGQVGAEQPRPQWCAVSC